MGKRKLKIEMDEETSHYNVGSDNIAVEGYDLIEYFRNNQAIKGSSQFRHIFDGIIYQFSTAENLSIFKGDPQKYLPQYGGFCALGFGLEEEYRLGKYDVNPEAFKIIDGRLYLFYKAWGTNALEMWNEEDEKKLLQKADLVWERVTRNIKSKSESSKD